jgi:ParB family chromosome partitioning protein
VRLAQEAASQNWSVRELEQAVRGKAAGGATGKGGGARRGGGSVDPDIARLEQSLGELLCAPVSIRHGRAGAGQLVIRYHSPDELEGILERIRRD